jgi:hypothetical protein
MSKSKSSDEDVTFLPATHQSREESSEGEVTFLAESDLAGGPSLVSARSELKTVAKVLYSELINKLINKDEIRNGVQEGSSKEQRIDAIEDIIKLISSKEFKSIKMPQELEVNAALPNAHIFSRKIRLKAESLKKENTYEEVNALYSLTIFYLFYLSDQYDKANPRRFFDQNKKGNIISFATALGLEYEFPKHRFEKLQPEKIVLQNRDNAAPIAKPQIDRDIQRLIDFVSSIPFQSMHVPEELEEKQIYLPNPAKFADIIKMQLATLKSDILNGKEYNPDDIKKLYDFSFLYQTCLLGKYNEQNFHNLEQHIADLQLEPDFTKELVDMPADAHSSKKASGREDSYRKARKKAVNTDYKTEAYYKFYKTQQAEVKRNIGLVAVSIPFVVVPVAGQLLLARKSKDLHNARMAKKAMEAFETNPLVVKQIAAEIVENSFASACEKAKKQIWEGTKDFQGLKDVKNPEQQVLNSRKLAELYLHVAESFKASQSIGHDGKMHHRKEDLTTILTDKLTTMIDENTSRERIYRRAKGGDKHVSLGDGLYGFDLQEELTRLDNKIIANNTEYKKNYDKEVKEITRKIIDNSFATVFGKKAEEVLRSEARLVELRLDVAQAVYASRIINGKTTTYRKVDLTNILTQKLKEVQASSPGKDSIGNELRAFNLKVEENKKIAEDMKVANRKRLQDMFSQHGSPAVAEKRESRVVGRRKQQEAAGEYPKATATVAVAAGGKIKPAEMIISPPRTETALDIWENAIEATIKAKDSGDSVAYQNALKAERKAEEACVGDVSKIKVQKPKSKAPSNTSGRHSAIEPKKPIERRKSEIELAHEKSDGKDQPVCSLE